MIYLSSFTFPSLDEEGDFFFSVNETCYSTFYPFRTLCKKNISRLIFDNITMFYGGNGTGKTTALNVIAQKLHLERDSLFNSSNFFDDYTALCDYETERTVPSGSRIITSDDIFDNMLDLRSVNQHIDNKRKELFREYNENKYSNFRFSSMEDYERLKEINESRRISKSQYTRRRLMDNVREHSNGESAFMYFSDKIRENRLYLLDEPENSLSPDKQLELCDFIADSVRFFGCQFIISTHSPFLLSLNNAMIYDLDGDTISESRWTELKNIRTYYEFFKKHSAEFEE